MDGMSHIQDCLDQLANGDLTCRADAKVAGELAQAFNRGVDALNEVLRSVDHSTHSVAERGTVIADQAMTLSHGTTEQAATIEEISATMNEVTRQTQMNATQAVQARDLANQARNSANTGDARMKDMVGAMSEIEEVSRNIARIIKVIDEIAFQTNLLALNAAVEAARAGVHGKGFAVVAEEVRNLAARSAQAAKDTTGIIEGTMQKVGHGTKIASETANALAQIVAGVGEASALVESIARQSQEQAEAIASINDGLEQVSQVVHQNSAIAEEAASSAGSLQVEARHLRSVLARVNIAPEKVAQAPQIDENMMAAFQAFLAQQGMAL